MRLSEGAMIRVAVGALLAVFMALPAHGALPRAAEMSQGERHVRPVFTLLIGQPEAPGLPTLSAVSSDVAMMHAFFRALDPTHNFVHLPAGDVRSDLSLEGTSVGPPTWPSIDASVKAIAREVDALGGGAEIYVYYAGHGRKRRVGAHTHTDLFLHPSESGRGEGYDGVLSTRLLQHEVLEPLQSDGNRVHLIVDACQSAYLLEARGMRRTERVFKAPPTVEPAMLAQFSAFFGDVGALLATSGSQVTYESARSGGLFSYAVRTAGVGLGDIDGDGQVTYGELSQVLPRILSRRAGGAQPTLLAPGDRGDVPFLDYRGRRTSAVVFRPQLPTRFELNSMHHEPFAAVFPTGEQPMRVYLPEGAPFLTAARVDGKGPRIWSRFRAANDVFAALAEPFEQPRAARSAEPDVEPAPLVLPRPLTHETMAPVEQPEWVWVPDRYTTLGVSGLTESTLAGRTLDSLAALSGGVEVAGAYGSGPDQIAWRLGYTYRSSSEYYAPTPQHPEEAITERWGHMARLGLGYSRVIAELSLVELSAGGFGAGGLLVESRGYQPEGGKFEAGPTEIVPVVEIGGELTARVLLPDSVWAVRTDLRISGQHLAFARNAYTDVVLGATLGLEYEFVLH